MESPLSFRSFAVVFLVAGALVAQEAPPAPETSLENTGKPMTVPFRCTGDDMQWAGMTCSVEEPCPVYLELTGVESIGNKLFASGNIHSQAVTLYSLLLGSDDQGHSWREAHPRIRGAGIDHVQFADLANGWASGETLFPLPQDAFLLSTADGGKTWRRHSLFSESRAGSIQQIWFSSRTEGSLVFDRGGGTGEDRYELYQSGDGGETWNLVESKNQLIRIRSTAAPATWRVQAEAKTKSFRIEHDEGTKWTAVASFTVTLGACQ